MAKFEETEYDGTIKLILEETSISNPDEISYFYHIRCDQQIIFKSRRTVQERPCWIDDIF